MHNTNNTVMLTPRYYANETENRQTETITETETDRQTGIYKYTEGN